MTTIRPFAPLTLMLLTLGANLPALAQPPVPGALTTDWTNATVPGTAATNNWSTSGNWSGGVPNGQILDGGQDFAVINNGGVAYVNSVVSLQPSGVSLGTNAGQSGTLDVLSGGSLTVTDDPFGLDTADGSVRVGQGGTGSLIVRPGGTLNSVSLTLGAASANSTLTLGGTAAGATTLSTGAVTLGATTRVIGGGVNFSASGPITLQGTSVLIPELTGATHSALKTTGNATVAGALQVDLNGASTTSGSTWTLFDAATIGGSFASIVGDPAVPLALGQGYRFQVVNGGNGKLGQLAVVQQLVLNVNRNTGAVTISNLNNPGGAGVATDGYTIQSTAGSLNMGAWQSLQDNPGVAGAGWEKANPTANRVSELRSSGNSTLALGSSWAMGNLFQPPTPTQFGQSQEDLVFQYDDPVTQTTVSGAVNYVGGTGINNLVLFADPATGNVKIRNTSPFTVAIDGYTIASAAGSLNSNPALWTSLQDSVGNTWAEANLSDNRVSELQSSGSTTLTMNGGTTLDLGGLFKTAGVKDLVFQFVLSGDATANTGVVLYEAALSAGVPGDYNKNHVVDAADYTIWRDHLNQSFQLDNEGGISPGVVDAADYAFWKSRFGMTSGSGSEGLAGSAGAVPEPSAWLLAVLVSGVVVFARRHVRT